MRKPLGRSRGSLSGVRGTVAAVALTTALAAAELVVPGTGGGDEWQRLAAVTMIVPIAFARRVPLAAAGVQLVAGLVNALAIGHLVRCGSCLPAAFFVAYMVGNRATGRARDAAVLCALGGVAVQCEFDPRLGPGVLWLMAPVTLMFFAAGLLVRARSMLVCELRESNRQLREQRERTAHLAVAADQERIRVELVEGLLSQIAEIAALTDPPPAAMDESRSRLAAIEHNGRAALERMRDIVGAMRSGPVDPEPGLDELPGLVESATSCQVRLSVAGTSRALPASIELSGYRIIERLLAAIEDAPTARAHVQVVFTDEALELAVTGPIPRDFDPAIGFAGISDRAALHGGTLRLRDPAGRLDARVRLPLVSHA